jgi:radical SAM superfamily enzyme YgiQ (UPF0313 family)
MRYEGPIYRPPSEADSLLIQATVGCPHNKCTFCMIYKKGPPFRIRSVEEICEDIRIGRDKYGEYVRTLFFPAGNTIIMPTEDLAAICRFASECFSRLERITVYGSSMYIAQKSVSELRILHRAGLRRIHVGLESGEDEILKRVKKGTTASEQIKAGKMVRDEGIELSEYVILGLGGTDLSISHAQATARVLNQIGPDFIRLRTLVPKINTLLLHQIKKGRFQLLSPHQVLRETRILIEQIECPAMLTSDHYTNYVTLEGRLPDDRARLLRQIDEALTWDEAAFRPFFVGEQ